MDLMDTYGHLITVNIVGVTTIGRHLVIQRDESRKSTGRNANATIRSQLETGFNIGKRAIGKKMKLLYENRSYKYLYVRLSWQFLLFLTTLNIFAAIYQAFEQDHDDIDNKPRTSKDIISNFSSQYNISESAIRKLFSDYDKQEDAHKGNTMSYMEAIILTLSVFYTIGWGQVIPRTTAGKLFCILSSCIGIPITFVMVLTGAKIFQRHMHDLVQYTYGGCKRKCDMDNVDVKNPKSAKILLLSFLAVLLLYILTTAAIIMAIEGFTYIDSLYYCFVSLSTIGFGDLVQQQLTKEAHHGKAFGLTAFLFFWIMFGIIMVAANLLTVLSIPMKDLLVIPAGISKHFERENNPTENHHGQGVELLTQADMQANLEEVR